ncbi:MAG: hypothetical protein ACJA0G_001425 [Kangiellaceae bacterium]|jgi:hypothetical protein
MLPLNKILGLLASAILKPLGKIIWRIERSSLKVVLLMLWFRKKRQI